MDLQQNANGLGSLLQRSKPLCCRLAVGESNDRTKQALRCEPETLRLPDYWPARGTAATPRPTGAHPITSFIHLFIHSHSFTLLLFITRHSFFYNLIKHILYHPFNLHPLFLILFKACAFRQLIGVLRSLLANSECIGLEKGKRLPIQCYQRFRYLYLCSGVPKTNGMPFVGQVRLCTKKK